MLTPGASHHQMSLTACLEALQTLGTLARDVRGAAAGLELRLGALEAAAALVISVLTALAARGRGGTLQREDEGFVIKEHCSTYCELPCSNEETAKTCFTSVYLLNE